MLRALRLWWALALIIFVVWSTRLAAQERKWRDIHHDEPHVLAPSSGVMLINPELVAANDSCVVVFDAGDRAVKAFQMNGRMLWSARLPELRVANPTDLQVSATGDVWIADPGRHLVIRVGHGGQTVHEIPMTERAIRVVPLNNGDFFALGLATFGFWSDTTGDVRRIPRIPKTIAALSVLAREGVAAPGPGGSVVIAFRHASSLLRISDGASGAYLFDGIEEIPFPDTITYSRGSTNISRLMPNAKRAALALSVVGNLAYVHFANGGKNSSVIDAYDLLTGAYRESVRLPTPASWASIFDTHIVALLDEPSPRLVVWSLRH